MLPRVRIPSGAFKIVKEVARHLLRRPVVGIVAAARTADGRWLLVRRGDTGRWALPGGTLEWGETFKSAITRELFEETGAQVLTLGELLGVYSAPERDPRFHAVTVVVAATVGEPAGAGAAGVNPVEITEVKLFSDAELPADITQGMEDVLQNARSKSVVWE
jgi:8-oxo-dGTP diphosphatase